MLARTIMVQGTASSVGKSLIVTALCRYFAQRGLKVAPFKSQNMALNSFVTPSGHEIGRAQAVQAEAARVVPTADMNPILIKPEGDSRSQIVVLGKSRGSMSAREYQMLKPELRGTIGDSLRRLREAHDIVVIEGAGSPAEINLKAYDIVNMHVAKAADAPVLLVGDIDRGGVFAAFVGTLELLEPDERARVAAFVVNKFRGDVSLLRPGLDYLSGRTGIPVLGVLPYVPRLRIADEDSLALEDRRGRAPGGAERVDIAVVRLPRISNYDDFAPLEHEADVVVRFVERPDELAGADLVVLPGTKNTLGDLAWLRKSGMADVISRRAAAKGLVLGICGGCQMLGGRIEDPHGVESPETAGEGLGVLPIRTRFGTEKRTAQVMARAYASSFLTGGVAARDSEISGYEIHMGVVAPIGDNLRAFDIYLRNGESQAAFDGSIGEGGAVVGTMIHGLFDNTWLRRGLVDYLRDRKGLSKRIAVAEETPIDAEYDRLAGALSENVDVALLDRIIGLHSPPPQADRD